MKFSTITLAVILLVSLINYFYVRKNAKNWGKEHFIRRKSVSLEDVVKRFRMLKQLFRIVYILSWGILVIIAVNFVIIYTNPDTPQFWTEFIMFLIPVPFIVFLIYKTLILSVERTEELYREEQLQ